jgi:hypothetical protein
MNGRLYFWIKLADMRCRYFLGNLIVLIQFTRLNIDYNFLASSSLDIVKNMGSSELGNPLRRNWRLRQ